MAEFPALPLWTDAYLADTSHLGDDEHGRYLLILFHLWRMPNIRFPNDDLWLSRKFGRSLEVFVSQWKPLMREFLKCDGNYWTSTRLVSEWEYLKKVSYQRSGAAKARWAKEKDICERNAVPHAFRNAPTPTPTPTPLKKVVVAAAAEKAAASKTGTRWRTDAVVPFDWVVMASASRASHSLPEIDLALEAERFANYWTGKSGKDATKLDWRKTWINWALSAKGQMNGHGNTKQSANDKFLAGAADAIREALGPAADGGDNIIVGPFGRPLLPS